MPESVSLLWTQVQVLPHVEVLALRSGQREFAERPAAAHLVMVL